MISTSFNLQSQPLCILASPGSCIYVIYPKLVATYTESVKTAQFILNEPIKHCSLYLYSLFICYESDKVERRELFAWQDPAELGQYKDLVRIKAYSQNQLIVIFEDKFIIIELADKRIVKHVEFSQPTIIKDICFILSNESNQQIKKSYCFVLEATNKISKFQISSQKALFEKSISFENQQIIYFSMVSFSLELMVEACTRQYLMVVNKLGQLSLFLTSDKQFSLKFRSHLKQIIQKPALISVPSSITHIHFNPQTRVLHVKIKNTLYSITFKFKQILLTLPIINHYIESSQFQENVEGDLVCSNKQGAVIKKGLLIYQIKKSEQQDQLDTVSNMNKIKKEKEQIAEEISNYSRAVREIWNNSPIDPFDLQYQNTSDKDVEQEIWQSIGSDELDEENLSQSQKQRRLQKRIEEQVQKQIQKQLRHMHQFQQSLQRQKQILEQIKIEQREGSDDFRQMSEEIANHKPYETESPNESPNESDSDCSKTVKLSSSQISQQIQQPSLIEYAEAETQTQDYFPFELDQIQEQVESKIQKFVEIIEQQLEEYHSKIESDIQVFKQKTNIMIEQLIKNEIPKQIKSYLNDFLVSKIQRYVAATFNKLKQMIEIGNNYNIQQSNKEKVKDLEITTHIIDKNKEIIEKVTEIVRISIGKFQDKKQEMVSDLETKSNLLNDLTLQVEELVKKFEDQIRQSNKADFDNKIEVLMENLQQATALIKTKLQSSALLPTILQTGESHLSTPQKMYPPEQYNPYYHNNNSYYQPPPYYPPYPSYTQPPQYSPHPQQPLGYPPQQLLQSQPQLQFQPPPLPPPPSSYQSQSQYQPHPASPHSQNHSQFMNTSVTYPVTYPSHQNIQQSQPIYSNQNPNPNQNNPNQGYLNQSFQMINQTLSQHQQPLARSSTIHSIPESFGQPPQLYRQFSNPQPQMANQTGFLKSSNESMFKSKMSR